MKKWVITGIVALLAASLAGIALIPRDPYRLRAPERQRWAASAIRAIASNVADTTWLTTEKAKVNRASANESQQPQKELCWLSDRLMLMKNGDWIVYRSMCNKENPRIYDIFIGRGSDGKWYYSTFHFCVGMCALAVISAEQPSDLSTFVRTYSLRESDGRPEHCLERTWFPGRR